MKFTRKSYQKKPSHTYVVGQQDGATKRPTPLILRTIFLKGEKQHGISYNPLHARQPKWSADHREGTAVQGSKIIHSGCFPLALILSERTDLSPGIQKMLHPVNHLLSTDQPSLILFSQKKSFSAACITSQNML